MRDISATNNVTISIITATYNAAAHLPRLIESLAAQTDADFEWVVADGASTDGTLALFEQAKARLKNVVVDSRPDFGIYDALNRAVKLAQGEYYLVLGADDVLFPDAIARYKEAAAHSQADLVTASVKCGERYVSRRNPPWVWLYGASAIVSSHAVGTLIKKTLHYRVGFYDAVNYSIYADSEWMLRVFKAGAHVCRFAFVAGEFGLEGVSNRSQFISFVEQLRAQIANGSPTCLQAFMFALRVCKWRSAIAKQVRLVDRYKR